MIPTLMDPENPVRKRKSKKLGTVTLRMDRLRRKVGVGRREDFEKYLAAVPDVPPMKNDGRD